MAVSLSRVFFIVLLLGGLGLAPLPLHAQRTPPAAPPPAALPQVPGDTVPVSASAAEPPVGRVHFINAPVADILHWYEQYSGKHVLSDTNVQGSITIDVDNVTRTDALRIMETALSLNGFTLVAGDNNIVKVIGINKQVRDKGLPFYSDLASMPDTEQVVTFLVRLRFLDPAETAGIISGFLPVNPNLVNYTALRSAGAILLTDTARNVRRLVNLIAQLDVPSSPVTEKFIPLQRADATKAIEFLNGVFDLKSSGSTPGQPGGGAATSANQPNNRRPIRRIGEDGQPVEVPGLAGGFANYAGGLPVLSGESLIQGRITLTADIRTNRIHVVTSPVNMPLVERLLAEYDAETPFAQPVRFPLRFVTAGDMLPILVDSLKEQGSEGGNNPTSGASTPSPSRSTSGNNNFFGNNSNNSNGSSGGLNGGGSSGNSNFGDDNNAPEVDTRPAEATVGNNRLIADQRTNTIILLGGADAKSKVSEILHELDKRPQQVVIRTVIGELSLDNNHELGFQYLLRSNRGSLLSNFNSGQLGQTTTVTPAASPSSSPTTATSALNTFGTLAAGLGSNFTGVGGIIAIGKNLDLIVSALDASNRFKTISTPRIVTQNNKRAYISSGTKIAIAENSLSSLTTSGNSTGISSTTTYIDVLLKLSVTPLINSEKEVSLDISQQLNSLAGTSNSINGSTAPNINTRELKNYVTARNGETIYLGGLITQSDNKTSSDIPYLSRIPVLGELFKTKTRDGSRSELIILLHPEVVATADVMDDLREREENRTYLGHDLEDQLLPSDLPVRKALPVNKSTATVRSTTATYVPDDKLHPAARRTVVKTKTTTVRPD